MLKLLLEALLNVDDSKRNEARRTGFLSGSFVILLGLWFPVGINVGTSNVPSSTNDTRPRHCWDSSVTESVPKSDWGLALAKQQLAVPNTLGPILTQCDTNSPYLGASPGWEVDLGLNLQ